MNKIKQIISNLETYQVEEIISAIFMIMAVFSIFFNLISSVILMFNAIYMIFMSRFSKLEYIALKSREIHVDARKITELIVSEINVQIKNLKK